MEINLIIAIIVGLIVIGNLLGLKTDLLIRSKKNVKQNEEIIELLKQIISKK